jgi:hypothetical protein
LQRARLDLLKELSSLPFLIDTPTLEAKKANLEVLCLVPCWIILSSLTLHCRILQDRLLQVDQAIALYSRRRLFVEA